MRTRYRNYAFYGIDDDEKKKLLDMCQNLSDEQVDLLLSCAKEAGGYADGDAIAISLMYGIGYYKLSYYMFISYGANDFYAYRRKTLWLFKSRLEEQRHENMPEFSVDGEGRP